MPGSRVSLRIGMTGADQVRGELATLGPAGASAMRQIAAASAEASGALRALDAGVQLGKEHIHALAEESGGFGKVLSEIGPAGLAVGAGLGLASIAAEKLFEQTKQAGEFVEGIEKTARVVGVSTDALQEYHHAAGQFGIDNEAADRSLQSLNEHIGRMQTGVRDARDKKIFAQLGLTREDFADVQNAADFLPTLADRLDQLDSEAKRVSIAKSLGVEEMLPLLEAGSSSINRLRQDAHDLGIVISEDLITHTSEANRQMKQASEIIKTELTVAFAPLMGVLARATTDLGTWIKQLEGWIDKVRDAIKAGHDAKRVADDRGDGAGGLNSNAGYTSEIERLQKARALAVQERNVRGVATADQGIEQLRQKMATADAEREQRLKVLNTEISRLEAAFASEMPMGRAAGSNMASLEAAKEERAALLRQQADNSRPAQPARPATAQETTTSSARGPRAADHVDLGEDDDDRKAASEAQRKAAEAARKAAEEARQAAELGQRQDNSTAAAISKADKDLLSAKHDGLKWEQDKANAAQEQYQATVEQINHERADRDKELREVDDQGKPKYRVAQIAQIEAAEEAVRQQKLANAAAERDRAVAEAKSNQELQLAALGKELLQSESGLALTTDERRQFALELLEQARADEWAAKVKAAKDKGNVSAADLDAQKALFDQNTALMRQSALRANQSPLGAYRDNLQLQAGAGSQDHAESEAVEDLTRFDDALVQVETGAETIGKAMKGLGTGIEEQILHDLNQQFIVAPLSKTIEGFIQQALPSATNTSATSGLQLLAQAALAAAQRLGQLGLTGGGALGLTGILPSSATDGISFGGLQAAGQWADFDSLGASTGGLIRGPGSSTSDSIPARLSDGEFVVRAEAVRQHLPVLHAINNGSVASFSDGGYVGSDDARRLYRSPGERRGEPAPNSGGGDIHLHNHTGQPMRATSSQGPNGDMHLKLTPLLDQGIRGYAASGQMERALRLMPSTRKMRVR